MFRRSKTSLPPPDAILLILAGVLVLVGLIVLTSASGIVAYNRFGDSFFYIKRQLLFGLLPGALFFMIGFFIPYPLWRRFSFPFFLVSFFLLLLVFIPGIGASYGRAHSWLNIGGYSLQPSELMKIALLLQLSLLLEKQQRLFPFLVIVGIPLAIIALQPDVGTMILIGLFSIILYFVSGASWRSIAALVLLGTALFSALIIAAPYRLARVTALFSQGGVDAQGSGYQLTQSFVAIGSGGIFGAGLGASRQKLQYLPEVAGDSIFSIMAEELGFIVVFFFMVGLLFFFYRGIRIARNAPDQFSRLFTTGVFIWFLVQAFLNVGSMVGILPLTGLPLPFVSYGGTALVAALFALGIVANISRYARR